jgi:hypothetical protein
VKREFIAPSLKVKKFNKEILLEASTNLGAVQEELANLSVDGEKVTINQVATITL